MKKLLWLIVCLMTMVVSVNAQNKASFDAYAANDSTFADTQSITDGNTFTPTEYDAELIRFAGKKLRYSANCDAYSLAFGAIGIGFSVAVANKWNELAISERAAWCAIGGLCGLLSVGFYIAKIEYKFRGGDALEWYGNGIRYKF